MWCAVHRGGLALFSSSLAASVVRAKESNRCVNTTANGALRASSTLNPLGTEVCQPKQREVKRGLSTVWCELDKREQHVAARGNCNSWNCSRGTFDETKQLELRRVTEAVLVVMPFYDLCHSEDPPPI